MEENEDIGWAEQGKCCQYVWDLLKYTLSVYFPKFLTNPGFTTKQEKNHRKIIY